MNEKPIQISDAARELTQKYINPVVWKSLNKHQQDDACAPIQELLNSERAKLEKETDRLTSILCAIHHATGCEDMRPELEKVCEVVQERNQLRQDLLEARAAKPCSEQLANGRINTMTPQPLPPHIAALPAPKTTDLVDNALPMEIPLVGAGDEWFLRQARTVEHARLLERELLWAMEVMEQFKPTLMHMHDALNGDSKCKACKALSAYTKFKQYMEERR